MGQLGTQNGTGANQEKSIDQMSIAELRDLAKLQQKSIETLTARLESLTAAVEKMQAANGGGANPGTNGTSAAETGASGASGSGPNGTNQGTNEGDSYANDPEFLKSQVNIQFSALVSSASAADKSEIENMKLRVNSMQLDPAKKEQAKALAKRAEGIRSTSDPLFAELRNDIYTLNGESAPSRGTSLPVGSGQQANYQAGGYPQQGGGQMYGNGQSGAPASSLTPEQMRQTIGSLMGRKYELPKPQTREQKSQLEEFKKTNEARTAILTKATEIASKPNMTEKDAQLLNHLVSLSQSMTYAMDGGDLDELRKIRAQEDNWFRTNRDEQTLAMGEIKLYREWLKAKFEADTYEAKVHIENNKADMSDINVEERIIKLEGLRSNTRLQIFKNDSQMTFSGRLMKSGIDGVGKVADRFFGGLGRRVDKIFGR